MDSAEEHAAKLAEVLARRTAARIEPWQIVALGFTGGVALAFVIAAATAWLALR